MYKGLWEDSEGGGGNNVNTLVIFYILQKNGKYMSFKPGQLVKQLNKFQI